MKIWFASLTTALALNSASAQLFSPESLQYGLLGAMIGGSVGGDYHCGHYNWSGENAAIGAGAGLLFGTLLGEARRQQSYNAPYAYPPLKRESAVRAADAHGSTAVRTTAQVSVWQAPAAPQHQIPDAPRVPDAPTF